MRFSLLLCVFLAAALCGCGVTDTDYFRKTKNFYYSHVNSPVKMNTAKATKVNAETVGLVTGMAQVDTVLTSLERSLAAIADPNDGKALGNLRARFPWISAMYSVTPGGTVMATIPEEPFKQLSFSWLGDKEAKPRVLYGTIQDTVFGPEFILARPYFQAEELLSWLCISFDPRTLFQAYPETSGLTIIGADIPLQTDPSFSSSPLSQADWHAILRKDSDGRMRGHDGTAWVWLVRYLGGEPMIFAAPADKD